ncbi:nuclear transport factor 2 family protein [Chitinophaga eiseniae]|uniref:Nuclear transport factor 2 family protein n=1 Tax=Chitinophaga eiseniae TaxID=634771 RepID=A0A847SMQ1_9BACT|nr:nuclear transport factor 2 family protein [Chitinophaga eiseniae]NLR80127.1 nuclear transport factor 2 family protein [Chitinophaga eiseniae]
MIINELNDFIKDYFETLQGQDLALFDKVFNSSCVLYSQQDGATIVRPFAEYRLIVQGRKSPREGGYPFHDEVLMIDVLSPTMAMIKVRLRLFDNIMEDQLNVMKTENGWQIFAKHFYRVGSAN